MWKTVKLGDVLELQNGYAFKSKEYSQAGHFLIRITNVQQGYLSLHNPKYVAVDKQTGLEKFALKERDIVISLTGDVGRVAVVMPEHLPAALNQRVAKVSHIDNEKLDNNYLFYFLNSKLFRNGAESFARGAAQLNISTKDILTISIPLPPLAEQKRIVERLDKAFSEIDKAIATVEAKEGEVERLKSATLSAMLDRGSQSGESITEDEEDSVMWETVKLGEVCTVKTGKKDVNEGNPEGAYPFFTCAKDNTYSDTYSFDCEAILIAGNGAVGQTSYYEGKFEAYQRTYVLTEFTRILPKFLLFILQGRLIQSMSSMVLGNTIPYIKKGMLMDFRLPLPPLAEQKRNVERLDKSFAEIEIFGDKTQSCVENYSALKASILRQELTLSEAV